MGNTFAPKGFSIGSSQHASCGAPVRIGPCTHKFDWRGSRARQVDRVGPVAAASRYSKSRAAGE